MVPMWRRRPDDRVWHPMSELADLLKLMDEESAEKFVARIEGDPALTTKRRMSPAEAWDARAKERVKVGDWAAPTLLGPKLAQKCKVSDRLEMAFKDDLTRSNVSIHAILDDGRVLERGSEYLVWVNPLNPGTAYICDIETRYLGTARVIVPVRRGDMAGIQEQMRVVRIAEADLRRRLAPIAAARQRTRLRDRQHNLAVLAAAAHGPAPDGEGYDFEAFGLGGEGGFSFAELNDAGAAEGGEPDDAASSNADALSFLDELNNV